MATLDDSFEIARSLLDDIPEDVWTDAKLIPIGKTAYRRLQRRLASRGAKIMQTNVDLTLAAEQVAISTGSSPALPSDFLWPRRLEEFATGDSATVRTDMEQVDVLPVREMSDKLLVWKWEGGTIALVGSTVATTVRLYYEKFLTALVDQTSTLLIPGCEDSLGYRIAALAARSRGNDGMWKTFTAEAEELEAELLDNIVRVDQGVARRRRGYND